MSTQHTPGPVRVTIEGSHIVSAEDGRICGKPEHMKNWRWPANARRLAACWNACEGISTEALELGAIQDRIASACGELYEVKRQRNELLEALKEIAQAGIGSVAPGYAEIAHAAIAKATGGDA